MFISGRDSAISSAKEGKSCSIEELTSCLGRANVRAFQENPNRIHTEPFKRIITKCLLLILEAS